MANIAVGYIQRKRDINENTNNFMSGRKIYEFIGIVNKNVIGYYGMQVL